ncbi:MAG: hypothetical protein IKN37_08480, partial [Bacteroidales bacterium]|nr:hypothetical protein [Bacteroidales bacterium]
MRKLFLLIGMCCMVAGLSAQNRIAITEHFDRQNSCTFTRVPQSAWVFDTAVSTSGKAIWGFVPTEEGDSIELVSPMYDFTKYGYIIL